MDDEDEPISEAERKLDRELSTTASAMVDFCKDDAGFTPGQCVVAMTRAIAIVMERSENSMTDEKLLTMNQAIREYYVALTKARAAESRIH